MRRSSPIYNIDPMVAPLLLMHARDDERMPFAQGDQMRRALTRKGKSVDWLDLPADPKPGGDERIRVQAYRKLLSFLDQHLSVAMP